MLLYTDLNVCFALFLLLIFIKVLLIKSCAGGRHNMPSPPVILTFDLLTLTVVSESRMTWPSYTSVPILVLACLDLGPMYATRGRGHNKQKGWWQGWISVTAKRPRDLNIWPFDLKTESRIT